MDRTSKGLIRCPRECGVAGGMKGVHSSHGESALAIKELPEWGTCPDDGYAESQVRRVKNNEIPARAEPACMRLYETQGKGPMSGAKNSERV